MCCGSPFCQESGHLWLKILKSNWGICLVKANFMFSASVFTGAAVEVGDSMDQCLVVNLATLTIWDVSICKTQPSPSIHLCFRPFNVFVRLFFLIQTWASQRAWGTVCRLIVRKL